MIATDVFGQLPTGQDVHRYTLSGGDITVRIMDFGATVLGIDVPDATGDVADVVLGFDALEGYFDDPACFGATIGPVANRTAGASMTIDGTTWQMIDNNHGNNLHTDLDHGLHKRLWKAVVDDAANSVTMTCVFEHGELGLPGARTFTAAFSINNQGVFRIEYGVESDRRTYVAMTNHSYFNLGGHGAGDVRDHELTVHASHYLPVDEHTVPTGEIADVDGTVFDFRMPKLIGINLDAEDEQLARCHGYDHCFCVDNYWDCGNLRHAATLTDTASGRNLDVSITTPGLQVYTGNWLGDTGAKDEVDYTRASGVALEPEMYPDTMHNKMFPQGLVGPGHPYRSIIEYRFF